MAGGIGVVAAPVLALAIPAKAALGLILPLSLATDVISARYYWGHWVGEHVRALLPGMVLGIAIGAGILDLVPEVWFRRVLGAMACVFAMLQAFRDRVLGNVKPTGPWNAVWRRHYVGRGLHLALRRRGDFDVVLVAAGPDRAHGLWARLGFLASC